MERLPAWTQVPLTLAIGKPLPDQRLPVLTPYHHFACYLLLHLGGLALASLSLARGGASWLLLLPATYLTVAGARHLQVGGVHHMTHGTFSGQQRLDNWIGWGLSLYLMIEEYSSYRTGHLRHHSAALSTEVDPAVVILRKAGIRNGMPVPALKARIIRQILSPMYHLKIFAGRLASYFRSTMLWKQLLLAAWLSVLALLSFKEPVLMLVAWWLPMTVLYQSVVLIRSVVEHWPESEETVSGRDAYVEKTSAIFCGVALPEPTASRARDTANLAGWICRMTVELSCRYLFVCADGPNHDLHHLRPRSSWANDAALRLEVEEELEKKGLPSLTETWGFWPTFGLRLEAISSAPGGGRE